MKMHEKTFVPRTNNKYKNVVCHNKSSHHDNVSGCRRLWKEVIIMATKKKAVKKTVKKAVKKAVKKTVKKAVKKTAKKAVKKTTKKVASKKRK